jgi:hypothetical protein
MIVKSFDRPGITHRRRYLGGSRIEISRHAGTHTKHLEKIAAVIGPELIRSYLNSANELRRIRRENNIADAGDTGRDNDS